MSEAPDKFKKATGRSIVEWVEFLRRHPEGNEDMNQLEHKEMARLAEDGGASAWWAQGIAVEVERIIGRREVGQRGSGEFNANASKTIPGDWEDVFTAFDEYLTGYLSTATAALPAELDGEPSTSATEKWRYWRANFTDGTRVNITCNDGSAKGVAKTKLAVQHDKLVSPERRDQMKAHWKQVLTDFAASLK